jgi:hypothetical protein
MGLPLVLGFDKRFAPLSKPVTPPFARRLCQIKSKLLQFNAIRRGDTKAVEALLRHGAAPHGVTPDGIPLVRYAEENNRTAIVQLLRQAQGGASAA